MTTSKTHECRAESCSLTCSICHDGISRLSWVGDSYRDLDCRPAQPCPWNVAHAAATWQESKATTSLILNLQPTLVRNPLPVGFLLHCILPSFYALFRRDTARRLHYRTPQLPAALTRKPKSTCTTTLLMHLCRARSSLPISNAQDIEACERPIETDLTRRPTRLHVSRYKLALPCTQTPLARPRLPSCPMPLQLQA